MAKKKRSPMIFKVSPSVLKKSCKNRFDYVEDDSLPSKKYIDEILNFTEKIIKRNHMASQDELLMVIQYFRMIYVYHNKYENLDSETEICLMYRDLALFYNKVKGIKESPFI